MTEEQWLTSTEPATMLAFLRGKMGPRKGRLFACACCRRVAHLLSDRRSQEAVDMAERYADGSATAEGLAGARDRAGRVRHKQGGGASMALALAAAEAVRSSSAAALAACHAASPFVRPVCAAAAAADAVAGPLRVAERVVQCQLLRDLFGNPFRTVSIDSAWLAWHGGAAVQLAQSIYEERSLPRGHLDAARLAALADMLEEAGCCDAELLGHLRSAGPHVRGCHSVDAVLGRT